MTQNPALEDPETSTKSQESPVSPDWLAAPPESEQIGEDDEPTFTLHSPSSSSRKASDSGELAFDFLLRQRRHDDLISELSNEVQGHESEIETIKRRNKELSDALEDINQIQISVRDLEQRITTTESELSSMQHSSLIGSIADTIIEYPQTVLYPISMVVLMAALFFSNPLLALFGGLLLIITILHYGSKSN